MTSKFNEQFREEGDKPRFAYQPDPQTEGAFQILEYREDLRTYEKVGEYLLLDKTEKFEVTEKKIRNLVGIMNGRKHLVDFKNLTTERIFFNIIPETPENEQQKVVFRAHDRSGVSKENAVLTLKKGVLDDVS